MIQKRTFWDFCARFYNWFEKKNKSAYETIYALIRSSVVDQNVLELATGTGMIARNIADAANVVIATDYSNQMIQQAQKQEHPSNVFYLRANLFHLPYKDNSFPVIIISNALHIIPNPKAALLEIARVLKPNGILIAPTFTPAQMGLLKKMKLRIMCFVGFPLHHMWSPNSYCTFLEQDGWMIEKKTVLKASFPLTYVQCKKRQEDVI